MTASNISLLRQVFFDRSVATETDPLAPAVEDGGLEEEGPVTKKAKIDPPWPWRMHRVSSGQEGYCGKPIGTAFYQNLLVGEVRWERPTWEAKTVVMRKG